MATYAEFLKSQGASDDDIKVLDVPSARKAYDTLQSRVANEVAARAAAQAEVAETKKTYQDWYNDVANAEYLKMQGDLLTASGEAARYKEMVLTAQKQGLIKVAEGTLTPTPTPSPNPGTPGFDPNKYFTRDEIQQIAEGEGSAITMVADIQTEHQRLGLGPISFKDLRAKQKAAGGRKSLEQVWEETYKVPEVRSAKAKSDQEAYEKKLRDEGRQSAITELANKYGSPETRPLLTSTSPLARRVTGTMRDGSKQPWEQGGGGDGSPLQADRVQRVAAKVSEKFLQ